MSLRYARLMIFWGVLFVTALLLLFTGFGSTFSSEAETSNGLDGPTTSPDGGDKPEETGANWNIILGVVTAVTSGAGFIATTFFALREDRRDTALNELQIKNLERDIEQKNLEIDRLRQDQERYDSS